MAGPRNLLDLAIGRWRWENPLPQGNTLNGIWGSGARDAWAVGNGGTILPGRQRVKPRFPDQSQIYVEWHPRLFLEKVFGVEGNVLGIFRNAGVAGEVNQSGNGYYAYLGGVGVGLALPASYNVGINLYYRYDKLAGSQWQMSSFWRIPVKVGFIPLGLIANLAACRTGWLGAP